MKTKIFTFCEDTNSGTDSKVFGTEAALHAHMRQVILDSYGEHVTNTDGQLKWAEAESEADHDADNYVLELLNAGDIEGAFSDWNENSGFRKHLDTYNWDEQEIEVALSPEHARNAAFVHQFLSTFAPYVNEGEELPGAFAVDRIVEFITALQTPL